jgi:microcystin-dependent protein
MVQGINMKNVLILAFIFLTQNLWAVCTSPISRTNNGTNSTLTSTKYNLDLNTVYNKVNSLPGDCIVDSSLSGTKIVDATIATAKLQDSAVTTAKVADGAITAAKLAAAIDNLVPVGTVLAFAGSSAPSGYLLCNGASVSRTTYAALYAVVGTTHGTLDGSSFSLPDLRYSFIRGSGTAISLTGTGTASSNNGTFNAHGINRTGMKVRKTAGTLSGLGSGTDYYAIVIDANTLAFASTYQNALDGTKIALSGANTAVIAQWEDPDMATRIQPAIGGTTSGLGTRQLDDYKSHNHNITTHSSAVGSSDGTKWLPNQGQSNDLSGNGVSETLITRGMGFSGGTETRPANVTMNYIIKY